MARVAAEAEAEAEAAVEAAALAGQAVVGQAAARAQVAAADLAASVSADQALASDPGQARHMAAWPAALATAARGMAVRCRASRPDTRCKRRSQTRTRAAAITAPQASARDTRC
jgi:hypothetical protein